MANNVDFSVEKLENLRISLENQIALHRKALQHWQDWNFEYEALANEFRHMKNDISLAEMVWPYC
jgi:hypothetical protein